MFAGQCPGGGNDPGRTLTIQVAANPGGAFAADMVLMEEAAVFEVSELLAMLKFAEEKAKEHTAEIKRAASPWLSDVKSYPWPDSETRQYQVGVLIAEDDAAHKTPRT